MGDANPIRTLGDYSKPINEGYINTIELPVRNNVVPLRFDTIRLVQNGCSFHELWSEDPNQNPQGFLKLVDWITWERTCPGSTPREDFTTRDSLLKFFPSERIANSATISRCSNNLKKALSEAVDSFKDFTYKSPSSWHRPLAPSLNIL
ncbi:hypothetical protein Tco_0323933 [Tanacetum coccineum]